jgi:hypothetical protein
MLVFVFTITNVYACGEKNKAAKASKASYSSSCASKTATLEKAAAGTDKVEVNTANYKAETVDVQAHCGSKGEVSKASVMKADANARKANCPATKDCPVPCNKESKVENMKAESEETTGDNSPASISPVSQSSK